MAYMEKQLQNRSLTTSLKMSLFPAVCVASVSVWVQEPPQDNQDVFLYKLVRTWQPLLLRNRLLCAAYIHRNGPLANGSSASVVCTGQSAHCSPLVKPESLTAV